MPTGSGRWLFAAAATLCLTPALHAGSCNSLLDISPDGTRLLVTNRDNRSVTVVDTTANRALREVSVGDEPEGVTWIGDGPLAAVTVYRKNRVVVFDTRDGNVLHSISVAAEPYGIVAKRDGSRAWVTHEYPGKVSEIDPSAGRVVRELKVTPFVRGLALSPDERDLYVTGFYTGALYRVRLATGAVADTWPGFATDNLCRHVTVHPRRPKAYLTHIRSRVEKVHANGSISPQLSVCDLVPPNGSPRRVSFALDTYNNVYVVTNAWESALSPDGKRLYTVYAGTDDMNVSEVVDDDYHEIQRIGGAVPVGKNPRAVRVSPDGRKVYVYNTLDFAVAVYNADTMERRAVLPVCKPPKTPEWVRGKILFNSAQPPMTSRRWIACASCHPDGHTDGRVWQNPEGLRKTTALFGLAHTHPLHWSADRDEVQDFEYTIRGRLMQGPGLVDGSIRPKPGFEAVELDEHLAGRSADLDALAVYCNSFTFSRSPHAPAPGKLSPAAERGRRLFSRADVGCATCHSGPYYTDSSLQKPFHLHDVGTGADDPSEKMGPKYDTPTLLGVYRTAPYLHHGKARTLRDVLTTCNPHDKHGKTSHLKPAEIDDLVEFLKSLPYEPPPDWTPNTVKHRVVPARKE
jgi:YVTN family beta-propeller protein